MLPEYISSIYSWQKFHLPLIQSIYPFWLQYN